MTPRRFRPAFTLLEMILAISMVSLILAALHSVLWSGVRAQRECSDAAEADTRCWATLRLIQEDLDRLALQTGAGPGVLVGAADVDGASSCMLRLRTTARAARDGRGMLVDYYFSPGRDGRGALVRRSEPLVRAGSGLGAGEGDESLARYEVVAADLQAVRLRYFDGRDWTDSWDSRRAGAAPELVEVVLDFSGGRTGGGLYRQSLAVVVRSPALGASAKEGAP